MTAAALNSPEKAVRLSGVGSDTASKILLYGLLILLGGLHLHLALTRSINWDEFWFYSQVETLAQGRYLQPLQTLHTQMFYWWLPQLGGSEVEHIVIARLFMAFFAAIAAFAIYLVARKITGHTAACLATAAYLGGGFVLNHATSFRVDPIATATLGSALAIAMCTKLRAPHILALGALIALSAMVTIKFALWFPAFLGVALWRWEEEEFDWRYVLRWIAAGLAAALFGAALYLWHSSVSEGNAATALNTANYASGSAQKMFGLFHSPYLFMMQHAAFVAVPLALAALATPFLVMKENRPVAKRAAILLLWLPLLTPFFYHNSAPYFYVFILPPLAIASSIGFAFVAKRYGSIAVTGAIALFAGMAWFSNEEPVADRQHQLVSAVHEMFPEPVSYFDCCGMIGSFSKANGFMTPWGMESYRASGIPQMAEAMKSKPIPLLLDNEQVFKPLFEDAQVSVLHPEDDAALRESYRQFWGDVYIAGREIAPNVTITWTVLVPGEYTASSALMIEGKTIGAGGKITLARGPVTIANPSSAPANLTWGDNIKAPETSPPSEYWGGF